jgi:hypothetical protein
MSGAAAAAITKTADDLSKNALIERRRTHMATWPPPAASENHGIAL